MIAAAVAVAVLILIVVAAAELTPAGKKNCQSHEKVTRKLPFFIQEPKATILSIMPGTYKCLVNFITGTEKWEKY